MTILNGYLTQNLGAALLALGTVTLIIAKLFRMLHQRYRNGKAGIVNLVHHSNSPKGPQKLSYVKIFPPSTCAALDASREIIDLASGKFDIVPMHQSYQNSSPKSYIFSGLSVKDVLNLGHFPNYSKLSGVPLPTPDPGFDINLAKPRPYRPIRWEYHQTMSFKKMDPDFWIELENTYKERIKQRQDICERFGGEVLQAMPGSELACKELMEMVLQFLCTRYPRLFHIDGRSFINNILHTRTDLEYTHPLHVLRDNVPEDFALTLRDENTGEYVFRAGIICSSIGWNLRRKIGLNLKAIHEPVPDYKEKMELSMDRFFSKLSTSYPIQRGSWGLSTGTPLYMPQSNPDLASQKYEKVQDPNLRIEDIHLRVDWQTLRRLPVSGAVVFNFKVLFTPLRELQDEPFIPCLLGKVLSEGKPHLMDHKGTWPVEHVAKPFLASYHAQQVKHGQVPEDWFPQTLDNYPFFPGWERKWKQ